MARHSFKSKLAEATQSSEITLVVDTPAIGDDRDQAPQAYVICIAGPQVGKMFKLTGAELIIGRAHEADVQLQETSISRTHARLFGSGNQVFIEDLKSANGTYLNGQELAFPQQLRDGDKMTIGSTTILKFAYHDQFDEDYQKRMYEFALRDGLTQAFNKKYLMNHLRAEFSFARRHKSELTVIMIDVDRFKETNDTHGHLAGDAILVEVARLSLAAVRIEDTFARYGGEEFVIVCRRTRSEQALLLAERLRKSIENYPFKYGDLDIPVTVSMGIASFPEITVTESEELIAAADNAMYKAKRAGRNCVLISS
jgi:two-component system, cell cycle response regulator